MATFHASFTLRTKGDGHVVDLTERVAEALSRSGLREGIACVFTPSSTSAITTMEYEPGLIEDLPAALERLVPRSLPYAHDEAGHDGNGHAHVRASLVGPSLVVPFREGRPFLGRWQQIVLVEFDVRPRERTIVVEALGE